MRIRHRVVCAGAVGIAGTLLETAVDHHHGPAVMVIAVLTLLPLVATIRIRGSAAAFAGAAAATLSAQAVVATSEFGTGVQPTSLLLAMLAVVAVYRTRRVLIAAGLLAALGQLVFVLLAYVDLGLPDLASTRNDDAAIVSILATSMGAWALLMVWRDQRAAEWFAAERDQLSATYRDVLPMVSIHLDRQGRVLDANRMTCLLLDAELEDIIGRDWFALALPIEYRGPGRAYFDRALRGEDGVLGREVEAYTNEIVGADGQRRTVEWTAGWIEGPTGARASLLAVGRDITDELAARADARRARHEIDALRRLAQKVASLDDSRQAVVDAVADLTGASFSAILEPDRESAALEVTIASRPEVTGVAVPADSDAPPAETYRTACPVVRDRGDGGPSAPMLIDALDRAGFVVCQPIVGPDGAVGVLTLAWDDAEHGAGERDRRLKLTALVAHEAAISLRRRQSIHALERAALVDPLTGVANRRAFDAEFAAAIRRAEDGGRALSLAILDLNQFKAVNDTVGHEAGDDLLIRCANAWVGALRRGDLLARLGGDEFALVLPDCDEQEMAGIIERVRRSTPHEPGTAIGGATWNGSESSAGLIRRADAAQYADKAECHARARIR